ncbi:DUF4333 domain-containing protein [Nocardia asiatica]|uniref:DUF4333 domain-containing protein n=1 Tax=Nocardia asiatica TaxID=209252 RepID=UPI002454C868|nr:DUF4333 domain-containing protein [Nocardia asiatica]
MSGPYGPNDPGEGRNDPTQQWGGQQAPGGAGPTQQWGGQPQTPASAQPTQHWGEQQPQQQWGQQPQQPQWGQQPQQQWGQQPQQDWGQQGQQPQWGQQPQPQWGAPGQQPPQQGGKGKGLIIGLSVLGVAVVGAIVALVLVLTATDQLDQAAVQDGVKKVLSDSYGIQDISDVSCPSGQEVKVDATFECNVKVSGEAKKVSIKITKDDGTYEVGRPS